jgi:hypothetical protein
LAADRPIGGKFESWRRFVVRLTACVFLFQAVGLFAVPPHARQTDVAGAAMQSMPDCPHHPRQQNQHDGNDDSACPMCQTLGCALAGAAVPALEDGASERLIGRLRIEASAPSRAAPRIQSAQPRGPPALV